MKANDIKAENKRLREALEVMLDALQQDKVCIPALRLVAYTALKELKKIYNYIEYYVVLAYMPTERKDEFYDYSDTLLPDFAENVPPRYAIDKRNRWMIEKSNYVISYVYRKYGGAYKFYEIAKKKNKVVTNLAEK